MSNTLQNLKQYTTVVADTGDFQSIQQFLPEDATTNPSLILKVAKLPEYQSMIAELVKKYAHLSNSEIADRLAVAFGIKLLEIVPGLVSTEVDARLSFNEEQTLNKAHEIIKLYEDDGIKKDKVLIKIASTWQGIKAAEILEKEGIRCNLTLLFNFAQARACAEAEVTLISPFVGRILDWHKSHSPNSDYQGSNDPGVQSVRNIYNFYKENGYDTIVMAASFRNIEQIISLSGCDRMTIAPALLEELSKTDRPVHKSITDAHTSIKTDGSPISQSEFLWEIANDPMANEKLAQGIRQFAQDQQTLEKLIDELKG